MTPRQKVTLDFIKNFWAECEYGPSYREIAQGIGAKSVASVYTLVNGLLERGLVESLPNQARSVRAVVRGVPGYGAQPPPPSD